MKKKKSAQVIELEKRVADLERSEMHTHRALVAMLPGSKSEIRHYGEDSNSCSVTLILSHGPTGKRFLEPTAIISDHTGSYTTHLVVPAFEGLKFEAHKALGQFHSDEDYSRRDVCNQAFEALQKWDREQV